MNSNVNIKYSVAVEIKMSLIYFRKKARVLAPCTAVNSSLPTSLNMHITFITTAMDCTLPIARLAKLIK